MSDDLLPALTAPGCADRSVRIAGTATTYGELLGAASAVASSLDGVRRVAVLARATPATVVSVCGALLAGVTVVPVPPDSGRHELEHLLTDSGAEAWLGAHPDDSALARAIPVELGARASWRPMRHDPEQVAFVLYTSGTTGLPKGVLLSRRAIAACLDGLVDAWGWTEDDVLAHGLPLFHVHGLVLGVLGALRVGSGLVHTGRPTPTAYADAARDGATLFFGVPTVWSRIAADPESARALAGARLLVSGSAGLPGPVHARLLEVTGHDLIERYGMSETLITVATRAGENAGPGTVGRPLDGVETRLRDETGHAVPHDGESVGQLQVRGATLFNGYLNRPEATAESWTSDGWFRTGDVATIDADGVHRIVGRESTDLIKSGGYRIGAGEIEATLLGHPAVAECAVTGEPDPDLGERIIAWVVPAHSEDKERRLGAQELEVRGTELGNSLIEWVGEQLSAHKRPREVRLVTDLPRNEMGKVQKARLPVRERPAPPAGS